MASYGLIEAGGTKFVLGIADESGTMAATHRISTTTPGATISEAINWFGANAESFAAIGIGSFGPLQLDKSAADWGHVTRTPKPHWSNTDLVGPFARAFGCPIAIETDVNAAALAESKWGAGAGCSSLLYLTIGTGIGGGFVSQGKLLHGLSHPEMGHIRMPRHPDDVEFSGCCPFHGDCLEGLASGPAIIARWGHSLSELGAGHPGIRMIAWYIAQAMVTFQAVMEPERIVLGGGVTGTPGLIELVRDIATVTAAGYFAGHPKDVITAPGLGEKSGLLGALAVALSSTS
ncbi:MAG TPA: ROK family protein [Sphingorhabdus sp.]|nr:ROK family protein [Sphingorhabdus sp.]